MERETYITVLIGIIIGMALTRVVTFIAKLFRARDRSKNFWLHLCWVGGLILLIVENWWEMHEKWNFERVDSYGLLAFLLISPGLMYLCSVLLCPDYSDDSDYDLKSHYNRIRRTLYICLALTFLVYIPEAVVMDKSGVEWGDRINFMRALAAVFFVSCASITSRYPKIDYIVPLLVFGLLFVNAVWAT